MVPEAPGNDLQPKPQPITLNDGYAPSTRPERDQAIDQLMTRTSACPFQTATVLFSTGCIDGFICEQLGAGTVTVP